MIRDLSEVEALYHDTECMCSPVCRTITERLRRATMSERVYEASDEFVLEDSAGVRRYESGEDFLWYEAQRQLTALAKQHQRRTGCDFKTAFEVSLRGSPELARTYARVPDLRFVKETVVKVPFNPGQEIVRKMRELRRKQPHLSHQEAYHKVLDADPALKFAYAESRRSR